MSLYESDFARRVRSGTQSASSSSSNLPLASSSATASGQKLKDLLRAQNRPGSAPPASPTNARKGKGRDYGDRFIPQRDGSDLHASYQLLPDANGRSKSSPSVAPKVTRKTLYGHGDEDARKEEVNATFGNLLKNELFGSPAKSKIHSPVPVSPRRPGNNHSSSAPVASTHTSAGSTPHHHHPSPLPDANGHTESSSIISTPLHVPTTPSQGLSRLPGSAASREHHAEITAHVETGTRSSSSSSRTAYSPPSSTIQTTPTRKRLFTYASPSSSRATPLNYGIGGKPTGVQGLGLDDMGHEKYSLSPVGRESQKMLLSPRKAIRQMTKTPFKVLDAPELADDFYLNLVSWSSTNVLGVGLRSCVYLWSAQTTKVTKLCDLSSPNPEVAGDTVTGLEWTQRGSVMAIGTNKGMVEIWDAERCKKIRTMDGHTGRVGSLAWNNHVLSTGSRDRTILHRDTRAPESHFRSLTGHHKQEICGLKWNSDTDQLASGGNDNKLFIWDATNERPTWKFSEHKAAVKALAWSPHQRGVLASGGGTADKKIRFWNGLTGGLMSEWDTGSQVCNLMWSRNSNELVSTHGYSGGPVQNQIHVWKYPSMTHVGTLTGHTYRVLYLAMSPDGQTIVTGAGDETLRFWNAFQKNRGETKPGDGLIDSPLSSGLNPFAKLR